MNRALVALAAGLAGMACMHSHAMVPDPAGRSCPAPGPARAAHWLAPAADGEALDSWCATLGPVVVEAAPAASFTPGRDTLVVASWNVNAGAGAVERFLQDELGVTCAGATSVLRRGAPHFVLALQETIRRSDAVPEMEPTVASPAVPERPRPGPRVDIVAIARACGLSLVYAPSVRNGFARRAGLREDRGNAILSTLPLADVAVIELPFEEARRVAPAATIRGRGGTPLRVASLHLIAGVGPWRILTTGNDARARQARGFTDALRGLDALAGAPRPTLVAGDVNVWSTRETAFRHLMARLPDSPGPAMADTRGPFPTDHIFFRRGPGPRPPVRVLEDTYRRLPDAYNSDHHPLMVRLVFGP